VNTPEDNFFRLPAKPVRRVLEALAGLADRRRAGEEFPLPLMTLHLRTGRDIVGRILRLEDDSQFGWTLLVQIERDLFQNARQSAVYVFPDMIAAVVVHDPLSIAEALSDGAISAPAPSTPPPTKLEVQRLADELSKATALKAPSITGWEILWDAVPASGEPLRSLTSLIKDAYSLIQEATQDALGKEALGAVQKVRFTEGEKPSVSRSQGVLIFAASLHKGSSGRLSRKDLQTALSAAL